MGKFLKQYEILYRKAKSDLELAKYAIDGVNNRELEIEIDAIAFHLQQSAEKLLKSVLDFHGIKFPRTHDLELLINLMNKNRISLNIELDRLIYLNDYAIEGRYAVIHDDLDDIDYYINLIENLIDSISDILEK